MKKISLILSFVFGAFFLSNAQCTIDTTLVPAGKFFSPDTFPCVVRTVAYNQTLQFKIPYKVNLQDFVAIPFPLTVTIDSLEIDSISGFPAGISDSINPAGGHLFPGKGGCAKISGTTTAPKGNYPLTAHGRITVSGIPAQFVPSGDTTISLDALASLGNSPFNFSLDVINVGDKCRATNTGIAETNFNAIIKTYPNPATSVLNLDVNTIDRINGDLLIFDELGRKVLSEKIDWIGYQNKQINVAEFSKGIYILQLTDGKTKYSSKFSVE